MENKKSNLKKQEKDFLAYQNKFMLKAIYQAQKAAQAGEVPVGAVIVKNNKIIAQAFNKRNKSKNALDHAELIAIKKACKKLKDWRLENCDLFVTLMPCPMCAGAVVNARVANVFYGASNQNSQIFENILSTSDLNHKTKAYGGVLKQECAQMLKGFFKQRR